MTEELVRLTGMGIAAAVISYAACAIVIKHGKKLGIIDDPKRHIHPKVVHDTPVPRGGGIPIWLAVAFGLLVWGGGSKRIAGIIIGITLLAVIGILDDVWEEKVSPYTRLGINVFAALMVIGAGIGIAYISNPWGGVIRLDQPQLCFNLAGEHCIWVLADIFALVWLVWMQNIVGWSSGVDGQLPGFVIIAAITMALLGLANPDAVGKEAVLLAVLTAGAYTGFLPWNWWPQKIMPGYGGKSLAGFLLGILAIMSASKVGAMMLVLTIPFVDAVLVIFKRMKEGRSPVWGGREHLHHYLLDKGWGKRKIALFYWIISALMGWGALHLKSDTKYFTMAAATLVIGGVIVWLQNWSTFSKQQGPGSGSKTLPSSRR